MKENDGKKSQTERNRKYRNSSEEIKRKERSNSYKRTARTFIRHYATNSDLEEIEQMIVDKAEGKNV